MSNYPVHPDGWKFVGEYDDFRDWGEHMMEGLGIPDEVPAHVYRYIDFERFAQDLIYEGGYDSRPALQAVAYTIQHGRLLRDNQIQSDYIHYNEQDAREDEKEIELAIEAAIKSIKDRWSNVISIPHGKNFRIEKLNRTTFVVTA